MTDVLEIVRLTDRGQRRDHNEDAVASDAYMGLAVLADGMGGYNAGEVASEIAVLSISAELKEAMLNLHPSKFNGLLGLQSAAHLMIDIVEHANDAIYHVSQTQSACAGMGTTLVLGLFLNNKLLVGHIGDSRMYRLRNQTLTQITEDHSVLQEQIKSGLITPEQARHSANKNLVTRALGVDPAVELELNEYDVEVGDIYLMCSDGLTDMVDDAAIQSTLILESADLIASAQTLVGMANDNGGNDNISVILIKVNKPFEYKHSWHDKIFSWLK